ncbi:MAG: glycosyl hydrolase 53 family protein [Chloroherpetonaceae bacterium]|nr:glycosyl hydrolase 53 family protein [Chloroherpetonaceae bacterium]
MIPRKPLLHLLFLVVVFSLMGCNIDFTNFLEPFPPEINLRIRPAIQLRGADLSLLPEVRKSGITLKNAAGKNEDMFKTLLDSGMNFVRLRLFHSPTDSVSTLEQVRAFKEEINSLGRGTSILLAVHFSDTWADPSQQTLPKAWESLSFELLGDSLEAYTERVCREIEPRIIQIGNEINGGFLWPHGSLQNPSRFRELMNRGIAAVRRASPKTMIMLHHASPQGAAWFLEMVSPLDYDLIGFSYYPMWHGKSPSLAIRTFDSLATIHNRNYMVVETSYPFTLQWNDWTNNIVGLESQLGDGFPATPKGQAAFLKTVKNLVFESRMGLGICYWGGEWVSFKGAQATNGSPYENQALWDFQNRALPAIRELGW